MEGKGGGGRHIKFKKNLFIFGFVLVSLFSNVLPLYAGTNVWGDPDPESSFQIGYDSNTYAVMFKVLKTRNEVGYEWSGTYFNTPYTLKSQTLNTGVYTTQAGSFSSNGYEALSLTFGDGSTSTAYIYFYAVPTVPTGLSISGANGSGTLSWNPNPSSDSVTSYNIYLDGNYVKNVTTNSYAFSGVYGNHIFYVNAVNSTGTSSDATISYAGLSLTPTGLQTSNITSNSVDLSWSASSGATSYAIFRNGSQIASTGGTTYHISNLSPTSTYSFQIAAVNGAGQSSLSNSVNPMTLGLPPITPTGLSAGNLTNTSFTLYWLKQSDATSYNVYLDGGLTGNVSQPLLYNPSLDISNLTNGSTHTMTVTAVNQWGVSPASQSLNVTLLPLTPAGLQASNITSNSVDLSWSASSGATSYAIFQNGSQIASTEGTTYHISNLSPTTAYSFQIAAVNGAGQSPLSNSINPMTLGLPPITPTGLSTGNLTNTSFTLYWLKQSDATSYNVYLDGGLTGNVSQPLLYNPSLDISNLTNGSTHTMTVIAVNQWGVSPASQSLNVTLLPLTPAGLQASNITSNSLDLSWTASSGATSYAIFQNGSQIASTGGTTYHISNLSPTTAYSFQIAAVNGAGQSPLSNSINPMTLGVAPITPTGLSTGNLTNTSFTLYWLKQPDATSYNVYLDGTLAGNASQPLLYNPSLDISNLTNGSTHSLSVTAVNQWGESSLSQPLPVILLPPIPTGLKALNITSDSLDLSWSASVSLQVIRSRWLKRLTLCSV
jgi:chitodextrinase